jgi:hypothetical protein
MLSMTTALLAVALVGCASKKKRSPEFFVSATKQCSSVEYASPQHKPATNKPAHAKKRVYSSAEMYDEYDLSNSGASARQITMSNKEHFDNY